MKTVEALIVANDAKCLVMGTRRSVGLRCLASLREIAVIYLHNVKRERYVLGSRNRRLVVAVLAVVEP